MRIAIGIATRGRAVILAETLAELRRQTRAPDRILVCHTVPDDIAGIAPNLAEFLSSPPGLPRQRNALLDACDDCDVLLFLDDDFLAAPDYLAATEAVFAAHSDAVVTTGTVIADGAKGPGISVADGRAMLAADAWSGDAHATTPHFNGYGCNMAVRLAAVRAHALRFDEALPLYAWYEDIDFTRRLAAASGGSILRLEGARGVHLGTKGGRVSGVRLGYSQVVNPIYLARRGSFPWNHALPSAARHCAMNAARALWPEAHVDRAGRLRGNLLGLVDVARGRADPRRILEL